MTTKNYNTFYKIIIGLVIIGVVTNFAIQQYADAAYSTVIAMLMIFLYLLQKQVEELRTELWKADTEHKEKMSALRTHYQKRIYNLQFGSNDETH